MASSDVNDLTSGRALGDLTDAESRELDEDLARDQSLTRKVADMREALDALAFDAGTELPPSHLRRNVMAIAPRRLGVGASRRGANSASASQLPLAQRRSL